MDRARSLISEQGEVGALAGIDPPPKAGAATEQQEGGRSWGWGKAGGGGGRGPSRAADVWAAADQAANAEERAGLLLHTSRTMSQTMSQQLDHELSSLDSTPRNSFSGGGGRLPHADGLRHPSRDSTPRTGFTGAARGAGADADAFPSLLGGGPAGVGDAGGSSFSGGGAAGAGGPRQPSRLGREQQQAGR